MIGGIVTQTLRQPEGRVWVECEEEQSSRKCAIYLERTVQAEMIMPGDSIWWQGGYAFWTPFNNRPGTTKTREQWNKLRSGKDYDIRIKRIGFSGAAKPTAA
jgi:hypothetical protein